MAETTRRRLRSSTVMLGGMGVLAAALSACGSEPDKRCVDPNSYDLNRGYKVLDSKACKSSGGSSSGSSSGTGTAGRWYYGSNRSGGFADRGTFSKSQAVDRGGFGCSSSSGG
ncbi:hypothetical protein GCM10010218_31940 [Streptomyces mashuensis]|uniref:Lipoprotein n=1 Tax=Streptomyces mashuensis TaxID=33904 RepID=A0A919B3W0_9ACTN|nr:hypothetical protein [Streptomyces mashuensis]GHF48087.1 hypothetical protein GCM10010218_31940 [Streptomyces mashuensis]